MPPRDGHRLIDKIRRLAAVTGYWPLLIAALLLTALPFYRLEFGYEERMRIWGQLVAMTTEQQTDRYHPAMDMIWQRGEEHDPYRFIAGAVPCVLHASAII